MPRARTGLSLQCSVWGRNSTPHLKASAATLHLLPPSRPIPHPRSSQFLSLCTQHKYSNNSKFSSLRGPSTLPTKLAHQCCFCADTSKGGKIRGVPLNGSKQLRWNPVNHRFDLKPQRYRQRLRRSLAPRYTMAFNQRQTATCQGHLLAQAAQVQPPDHPQSLSPS